MPKPPKNPKGKSVATRRQSTGDEQSDWLAELFQSPDPSSSLGAAPAPPPIGPRGPNHPNGRVRYPTLYPDRIHPGSAKQKRVFGPIRAAYISKDVTRPVNRWRKTSEKPSQSIDIRNRPLMLAKLLPWLPQYNFARS